MPEYATHIVEDPDRWGIEEDVDGSVSLITESEPGTPGADGEGVPSGGADGTYLRKATAADYDTEWTDEITEVTRMLTSGVITGFAQGYVGIWGSEGDPDVELPRVGLIGYPISGIFISTGTELVSAFAWDYSTGTWAAVGPDGYTPVPVQVGDPTAAAHAASMGWTEAQLAALLLDALSDVNTTGVTNGQVLAYNAGTSTWLPVTPAGGGDMLAANNLSDLLSAATARTNLGLGTAALAASGDFDAAGLAAAALAAAAALVDDLSGVTNAATARTNLGLGTAATTASTAYDAAGTASAAVSAHAGASDPHGDRASAAALVDDLSGVTDAATARTNLGLGTAATTASTAYDAAGVAAALVDDLSGVSDAATARTNLGLGTAATHAHGDYDAAGVAAALVDDLSGVTDAATARTNLGLGTAATHAHGDYDAAGAATSAVSTHAAASDPHGDRAAAAALVDDLSGVTNAATARTNLGLGTAALAATGDFDAAGVAAALVDDLSGVTNAATARTNLGLGTAATTASTAYDAAGVAAALVDDLSGVSDAATARTNLGLGTAAVAATGDFVQAKNGGKEVVNTQATATGATTLDLANGNVFDLTLTGNITLTFSGPTSGVACSMTLIARQGSGSHTITWPASVKWAGGVAPTISTAASKIDLFTFTTVDNGTTWFGFTAGIGMA